VCRLSTFGQFFSSQDIHADQKPRVYLAFQSPALKHPIMVAPPAESPSDLTNITIPSRNCLKEDSLILEREPEVIVSV
jgi:hypothetical protein